MEEKYYAVTREDDNDLQHWKYIKKKKVNGKWRYIYDDSKLKKFKQNLTVIKVNKDGSEETTRYRKTKKLLDDYELMNSKETYKQGKITRLVAKGEKFIFDTFLDRSKKKKKKNKQKLTLTHIKNGKKLLKKIFNKDGEKKSGNTKYVTKIVLPDGKIKYRYDYPNKKKVTAKLKKMDKAKDGYYGEAMLSNGKTIKFSNEESYNDYAKRLEYQKKEPDFLKDCTKINIEDPSDRESNMKKSNPKYDPKDDRYSKNCFKCSLAYEMRMRGYDVQAAEQDDFQSADHLAECFKNGKFYNIKSGGQVEDFNPDSESNLSSSDTEGRRKAKIKYDFGKKDLEKAIKKQNPPNSRGILHVDWKKSSSGHSLIYEVDAKGKVIIRDTQTNKTHKPSEIAKLSERMRIIRTDNLELDATVMRHVRKNY